MRPVGRITKNMASRLLARDAVFRSVQRGLRGSLEARRMVDRNADRVWAALNLISRRDVERLTSEVERLQAQVATLRARVQELSEPPPGETRTSASETDENSMRGV